VQPIYHKRVKYATLQKQEVKDLMKFSNILQDGDLDWHGELGKNPNIRLLQLKS
jgi:hypothetical protein